MSSIRRIFVFPIHNIDRCPIRKIAIKNCFLSGSTSLSERRQSNHKGALPVLAYPVNSIRQCALSCPKGLRILAQGCCAAATLGKERTKIQPQRGCVKGSGKTMTQPFQGWLRSPCRPRVAARQPWADIRSPLGQKSALPNRIDRIR